MLLDLWYYVIYLNNKRTLILKNNNKIKIDVKYTNIRKHFISQLSTDFKPRNLFLECFPFKYFIK